MCTIPIRHIQSFHQFWKETTWRSNTIRAYISPWCFPHHSFVIGFFFVLKMESQFMNDWIGYNDLTISKIYIYRAPSCEQRKWFCTLQVIVSLPRSKRMKSLPLSRVTKCENLKKKKRKGKRKKGGEKQEYHVLWSSRGIDQKWKFNFILILLHHFLLQP